MTAISSVIFLISPQWPLVVPAILGLIENGFMGAAAAFSTVMIVLILLVIALMTRLFRGEGVRESMQI
jgi:iron(III) transport system permease protein